MVIHKLIATCDCGSENCIGKDGAVVNLTLSSVNEEDLGFLTEILLYYKSRWIEDRIEETTVRSEMVPLMREAIEDVYKIPEIAGGLAKVLGIGDLLEKAKEPEDPFKNLDEIELKEIG